MNLVTLVGTGCSLYHVSGGWSGLIVAVENRNPESHLHIKYDCMNSFNLVATRGHLLTFDSIPPLHRQIIVVLSQLEVSGGYQVVHERTHVMTREATLRKWGHSEKTNVPSITPAITGLHAARPL